MDEQLKELVIEGEKSIRDGELDRGNLIFVDINLLISGINLLHDALGIYKTGEIEDQDQAIESVIYSQLGNGYYMRKDFGKACEFHGKDCEVSA